MKKCRTRLRPALLPKSVEQGKKGRNDRGARYVHGGGSSGKTPGIRDGIANEHGKKRQIAEEHQTTEKTKGKTIEAHATFTVEGRAVKHPVSATASPRGK